MNYNKLKVTPVARAFYQLLNHLAYGDTFDVALERVISAFTTTSIALSPEDVELVKYMFVISNREVPSAEKKIEPHCETHTTFQLDCIDCYDKFPRVTCRTG